MVVADSPETLLGKDLGGIPEILYVLTERIDGSLTVWIVTGHLSQSVRRKIYQKELELIDGHPGVNFDFNLIPAMGRTIEELALGAHLAFSRSE